MVPPWIAGALKFLTITSNVGSESRLPSPPPDLQAERAAVSSCWEEVALPLKVRERESATSG